MSDVMTAARRHAIALLLLVGLGLALGVLTNVLATPIYAASAQVFVSVPNAVRQGGIDGALAGERYVLKQLDSYANLVDTPAVQDPAAAAGGGALGQLSAEPAAATTVIAVRANAADPNVAASMANAAAEALSGAITAADATARGDAMVKANVVVPAQPPMRPVAPSRPQNLALGLLLGLGLAALALLYWSRSAALLGSPARAADAADAPLLGVIPADERLSIEPLAALRTDGDGPGEAFAALRTNLLFMDEPRPRVLLVTSAVPEEGKTTVSANLAIALARTGARVIAVEADLRQPLLAECFEVDGRVGLTDALIGDMRLADARVSWHRGLLDILPSGPIPPNPAELLGSGVMERFVTALGEHYDFVVLDAAPVLPVADSTALAKCADGVLLVARLGRTRPEQVAAAAANVRQAGTPLLGVVANFSAAPRETLGRQDWGAVAGSPEAEGSPVNRSATRARS